MHFISTYFIVSNKLAVANRRVTVIFRNSCIHQADRTEAVQYSLVHMITKNLILGKAIIWAPNYITSVVNYAKFEKDLNHRSEGPQSWTATISIPANVMQ